MSEFEQAYKRSLGMKTADEDKPTCSEGRTFSEEEHQAWIASLNKVAKSRGAR